MSSGGELLAKIMAAASDAPEVVPEALIQLLSSVADPLATISDWDGSNEIFASIESQFPYVPLVRSGARSAEPVEIEQLAGLIRWLIRELRDWSKAEDEGPRKLTAFIVIIQFCDWTGAIWDSFPTSISDNKELLAEFERIIGGFRIAFGNRSSRPAPIWETEAVEAFQRADEEGDWPTIATMWPQFGNALGPPAVVPMQCMRFLARYSSAGLVRAVR